jgi:hypothetical protein
MLKKWKGFEVVGGRRDGTQNEQFPYTAQGADCALLIFVITNVSKSSSPEQICLLYIHMLPITINPHTAHN